MGLLHEQQLEASHRTPLCYKLEPCNVYCYHKGKEVDTASFAWDPLGGPLYTDGSAMYDMYPEAASAGAAAEQNSSSGIIRRVFYSFDRTMPCAAVAGEHVALVLATMFASQPTHVVSDCQAVVSLIGKCLEQR